MPTPPATKPSVAPLQQEDRAMLRKRVWRIALPMLIMNLSFISMGLVDTAILGHLGTPLHLGAVVLGAWLLEFFYVGFGSIRMSATGFTAQAYGSGDTERMLSVLRQSLWLGGGLGVLLILVGYPLMWMPVALLSQGGEIEPYVLVYCRIRLLGMPAVLACYAIAGWAIGMQKTLLPLAVAVLANVINIALDFYFILYLDMNSAGAAWASLCADWCAFFFALLLLLRMLRRFPTATQRRSSLLPQLEGFWSLLSVNRHLFVRTFCLLCVFSFFAAQGARAGTAVLAANTILMQLLLAVSLVSDSLAYAAETLCGEELGKKNLPGFQRIVRHCLFWALGWSVGSSLILSLGGSSFGALFTDLPEVLEHIHHSFWWLPLLPLVAVWSYTLDGVFVGALRSRVMQNLMLLTVGGVFLPIWYLSRDWEHGLWFSFFAFMTARSALMITQFLYHQKRQDWLQRSF